MPLLDSALFLRRKLAKHFPQIFPRSLYNVFLRHFGMNTTWYLQSHFVWLKLS